MRKYLQILIVTVHCGHLCENNLASTPVVQSTPENNEIANIAQTTEGGVSSTSETANKKGNNSKPHQHNLKKDKDAYKLFVGQVCFSGIFFHKTKYLGVCLSY